MREWLNKVQLQNIGFFVILLGCFILVAMAMFKYPPEISERIITKMFDTCLVGAIGWAFTQSKSKQ